MDFLDLPEKLVKKNLDINYKDTPWKMLILPESSTPMKFNQLLDPNLPTLFLTKSKRKIH